MSHSELNDESPMVAEVQNTVVGAEEMQNIHAALRQPANTVFALEVYKNCYIKNSIEHKAYASQILNEQNLYFARLVERLTILPMPEGQPINYAIEARNELLNLFHKSEEYKKMIPNEEGINFLKTIHRSVLEVAVYYHVAKNNCEVKFAELDPAEKPIKAHEIAFTILVHAIEYHRQYATANDLAHERVQCLVEELRWLSLITNELLAQLEPSYQTLYLKQLQTLVYDLQYLQNINVFSNLQCLNYVGNKLQELQLVISTEKLKRAATYFHNAATKTRIKDNDPEFAFKTALVEDSNWRLTNIYFLEAQQCQEDAKDSLISDALTTCTTLFTSSTKHAAATQLFTDILDYAKQLDVCLPRLTSSYCLFYIQNNLNLLTKKQRQILSDAINELNKRVILTYSVVSPSIASTESSSSDSCFSDSPNRVESPTFFSAFSDSSKGAAFSRSSSCSFNSPESVESPSAWHQYNSSSILAFSNVFQQPSKPPSVMAQNDDINSSLHKPAFSCRGT